jgi:hypothetical protein
MTKKALPKHFMVSMEGDLFDTRQLNWNVKSPLRRDFSKHVRAIKTFAQVKAALRAGPYAWPGGYQLYFIMADGDVCSFEGIRSNLGQVVQAMYYDKYDVSRIPISVEINFEDATCALTDKKIPSAYADDANE